MMKASKASGYLPALLVMMVGMIALFPSTGMAAPIFAGCPDIGVTYRVVSCFNVILSTAMPEVYAMVEPLVLEISGAAAILAVVVFGMRTATGGASFDSHGGQVIPQGAGEAVMLTLKIGLMMFFIMDFDEYYPMTFEATTGMIEIATSPLDGTMIDMGCTEKLNEQSQPGELDPTASDYRLRLTWARVDCLVGAMFGFGIMGGGAFLGIAPVLEGALTSSLNDNIMGSAGPLVVYMGYTMMFGIVITMFRTLYVYVYSMIAVAFLWMLAPFAGMCLLFRHTTEYFTKWVTSLLSMMLQPVLMLCFLTLMIVALDRAIYTSPYSLISVLTGKIACDPTTGACDYNVWKDALQEMRDTGKLGKCTITTVSVNRDTVKMNKCADFMQNRGAPAGDQEVPNEAQYVYNMVDPDCKQNMPSSPLSGFTPGFDGFTNFTIGDTQCLNGVDPMEMFASMAVIAIICYLLYQTMEFIPEFATRVTGGSAITYAADQSMPLQQQMKSGMYESSADYVKNKDPGTAMESFMRGAGGSLPWIGTEVRKQFSQPQPPANSKNPKNPNAGSGLYGRRTS